MKIFLTLLLTALGFIILYFAYYILLPTLKLMVIIYKSGSNGFYVILGANTNSNIITYTFKHGNKSTYVEAVLPNDYVRTREYMWDLAEITQKTIKKMREVIKSNPDVAAYQLIFGEID